MDEGDAGTGGSEIVSTPAAIRAAPREDTLGGVFARALHNLALQDHVMLVFHAYLTLRAFAAPEGPRVDAARTGSTLLFAVAVGTVLLTRGGLLQAGPVRAIAYRVGMFGSMLGSYFTLSALLWSLGPTRFDPALIQIDEFLFGATPAIVLDQYVTPVTVEWFAFFYYSYFPMLGGCLLPTLFFDKGPRRFEVLFAAGFIVAAGHIGYTLVPGVGPYAWPALVFENELAGGIWWERVHYAVASAGAMLDIFPSLHTALSVLIALHAVRYRKESPYKWVWLPVVFVVVNIVIATVFLRWHYAIDLVAGSLLAVGAYMLGIRAWNRGEKDRGLSDDRHAVWETIDWRGLQGTALPRLLLLIAVQLGAIVTAGAIAGAS